MTPLLDESFLPGSLAQSLPRVVSPLKVKQKSPPDYVLWLSQGVWFSALLLWFSFDNSWPVWDAASHTNVAFRYQELIRHARPWDVHWINQFLTVNWGYPVTLHAWNGLLKAIFGSSKWVDNLSLLGFGLILNFSTYRIALSLFASRLAALLSVCVLNMYPLVSTLSHLPLLDYPYLSLYAASMLAMLNWQKQPGWVRATVFGAILSLACSCKSTSTFFSIGPCVCLMVSVLWKRRFKQSAQLLLVATMVALVLLSWVLPNFAEMHKWAGTSSGTIGHTSIMEIFPINLTGYLCGMPQSFSPLLLALFGVCTLFTPRPMPSKISLFVVSSVVGLAAISSFTFQLPDQRYIAPLCLLTALFTGNRLALSLIRGGLLLRTACVTVLCMSLAQFLTLNYSPYPLALPTPLSNLPQALGMRLDMLAYGDIAHPTRPGDIWGQSWIVETIKARDPGKPVWLNVLPNSPEFNAHTLELACRRLKCSARPTTSRVWTPLGDTVIYSKQSMSYYDWYLVQSDHASSGLKDAVGTEAIHSIEKDLRLSGKFELVGERKIADGTTLTLFRKR